MFYGLNVIILVNVPNEIENNVYLQFFLNEIVYNVHYFQLTNAIVDFNYVLTDVLPAGSVHF